MAISETALTHLNAIANPLVRTLSLIQQFKSIQWIKTHQRGSFQIQIIQICSRAQTRSKSSDSCEGDEDIVSRKLETRIVELRKMGKLPNQNLGRGSHWHGDVSACSLCFYEFI